MQSSEAEDTESQGVSSGPTLPDRRGQQLKRPTHNASSEFLMDPPSDLQSSPGMEPRGISIESQGECALLS